MTNKIFLPLALLASFLLVQCNDAPTSETTSEGDSMAKFTHDSDFKNTHESPEKIDFQGKGVLTEFPTPDGKTGKAYVMQNPEPSGNYLLVIHEWWGLNDQIKRESERLFSQLEDVTVMALDLYDGKVTGDPDEAGKLMQDLDPARAESIVKGALAFAGPEARIATIGWCFGGGWSLRSSILAGNQGIACVIYYGMPVDNAAELAPIQAEMLGIFAKKDGWINEEVVEKFQGLAKATGKKLDIHWFNAEHAFANPSGPRYNEEAATQANKLALNFLQERLKP